MDANAVEGIDIVVGPLQTCDFVLVQGATVTVAGRSLAFGPLVDAVLLVALEEKTHVSSLERAQGSEIAAPREDNIVWAIGEATATLKGQAGDLPKALMLRFLLHFVSDG